MPHTNITTHDCKELAAIMSTHERRLNETDVWKERTSGQIQQVLQKVEDGRLSQERSNEMSSALINAVNLKIDGQSSQLHTMQLDNAVDRGVREQSQKNLYLFIGLIGVINTGLAIYDKLVN